jgi:hypothetical protein
VSRDVLVAAVDLAALGAFLSGAGAVVSAIVTLRLVQKRDKADCAQRVEEVKQALREGVNLGRGEQ